MTFPWPPPDGTTPVHGWGFVTLDPAHRYGEVIQVPADRSLAVGSLTFSDRSPPDPNANVTLQFETAAPGQQGQPGGAMSQFYQLTLASGASQHLAFPAPLVLSGLAGQPWVFRMLLVGYSSARFAEVNVLAVGYLF